MRIAMLADLHGHLPEVPECDLLLLAGDLCPADDHDPAYQAAWLEGPFMEWLGALPASTEVVGIAGNHDFVFERAPELVEHLNGSVWTYLRDDATGAGPGTVFGSPWTPWFHDWAFNAPKDGSEEFLAEIYDTVKHADVLLVHGPPRGYGDRTTAGVDAGSTALLDAIDRLQPRLCVFGHIHEGRGQWQRGRTTLVNASAVDELYELRPDPFVLIDL